MSKLGDELREELKRILDEPMPAPASETPEIETDGVFAPEFDLSGLLTGGLMPMLDRILTDVVKGAISKPEMAFKIHCFAFSDSRDVDPHNPDAWLDGQKKRNEIMEALLNDGWEIYEKIICPPNVMLILNRARQERQTNNDGSDKENGI